MNLHWSSLMLSLKDEDGMLSLKDEDGMMWSSLTRSSFVISAFRSPLKALILACKFSLTCKIFLFF